MRTMDTIHFDPSSENAMKKNYTKMSGRSSHEGRVTWHCTVYLFEYLYLILGVRLKM